MELTLGMDFGDAEKKSEEDKKTLPAGTYDIQCTGVKPGVYSKSQRPFVEFSFEVINHADWLGKKLRHSCPLPHEGNNSGIGFLVDVTKALGQPWTGTTLDTDAYVTRSCRANVINTNPSDDEQGRTFANIKSFVS